MTDHETRDVGKFLKTLSVLYVEDDPDVREQLSLFLRRRVKSLVTADDGQGGLDAFRRDCPDMVVSDVMMPGIDGLTMAESIKRERPGMPVIMTTAFERPDYLMRAIDIGVDKYVVKPVNTQTLYRAMLDCASVLQGEALRRESEERYRVLFENFHLGLCIARLDGRITDCNGAFLRLVGYGTVDELSSVRIEDLTAPECRDADRERLARLVTDGAVAEHEKEMLRRDGSRVPVSVQMILRRHDSRGDEIWLIVTDIGERRAAEEQMRLSAMVFERSGEAIYIADPENRILSVNGTFCRVTGLDRADCVGQPAGERIFPDAGAATLSRLRQEVETNGYWQGELQARRKDGGGFPVWLSLTALSDRKRGGISNFVGIFTDITERRSAEERIRYLAQHDILTGLPNRSLLQDRLTQAMAAADRGRTRLAVLFIDLDHFKVINDSLGHHYGDLLLKAVAHRLVEALRGVDTVSRLGGDEFVVVVGEVRMPPDAAVIANRIVELLGASFTIEGHELIVSPSIGISIYPDDGNDIPTIIKNADAAMYSAKSAGRNTYKYYTRNMGVAVDERHLLENRLRSAASRGELVLHYQPQVDLATRRLSGLEALLRWQHPERGLVMPDKFIPIAEETGLIVGIGAWVIEAVCRQALAWRDAGLPALPVAVNLSAMQFRQPGLPEMIGNVLESSGLAPGALQLELTESVIMQDAASSAAVVQILNEMGIFVAVDDFGTGYSSLAYLKRFQPHKLKIDKVFVRDIGSDPDDEAIIRAIISMAHSLGIRVIAEGVETPEQLDVLRTSGCDEVQGYLFCRPLPAAEVEPLLRQGSV